MRNRDLGRRLERLESRTSNSVEPLVIVLESMPSDYVLGPGERVVIDEMERGSLVRVVSKRVTSDPMDPGKRSPPISRTRD